MFDTSIGLLVRSLFLNILIPYLAGLLFVWLMFGTKFKGRLLHFLARFIGVGVVAHWLFNLQFIWFGVGLTEYIILLIVLTSGLLMKIYLKKEDFFHYLETIKVSFVFTAIKVSYRALSKIEKAITRLAGGLTLGFIITSFVFTTNFPTYADDSFSNRNRPVINILHDGGVKLFGEKDKILARGRLGYPIHIPLYKALISDFQGGYYDIYINLFQRLCFVFGISFITVMTWKETQNIMYTLIPAGLICSLPLVFFHSVEGYMELPSAIYSMLTIYSLYKYLQKKEISYVLLALILGGILAYIKNDGMVVYFPSILIIFIILLVFSKQLGTCIKSLIKNKYNLMTVLITGIFFWLPFTAIKIFHQLGLDPTKLESGESIVKRFHWEIFNYFKPIFFQLDNYGPILIFIGLTFYALIKLLSEKNNTKNVYLILVPITIFCIFTLVFLVTDNYQWMLDQTVVNRVYTMTFLLLLSFIGIMINEINK